MTTKTVLRATADSFTNADGGFQDRNYGDRPTLRMNATNPKYGWIEFSLKSLPLDAVVQQAQLQLFVRNTSWAGDELTASRITSRWREDRITASNAPTVSLANQGTATITADEGDEISVDVTAMVAQALSGADWHGIRIEVDSSTDRYVDSSDAKGKGTTPRLVVFFGETPDPPNHLHPRAGHACNAALPVFAWDADTQSNSWVQISTTDIGWDPVTGFPAPEYDDGTWVENTDQLYDMATTGYAGVPDDSTRYWSVKIQDEDGNESEFSEPARFERHTYGSLTIDSPTTDVTTNDPTVLTTFTGRTLVRIDWILEAFIDIFNLNRWYTVGQGTSDDDDFEITGIRQRLAQYRLTVRAFDEFQRGNVPNEAGYVEGIVEFGYTAGPTGPISSLTLTQQDPYSPVVLATWTRSVAPDVFNIFVGDVLVESVESGDAFVTGTTYAWPIYQAVPNTENTIRIAANDDGEDSPLVAETITPSIIAAYLLAPDDGIVLPIYGKARFGTSIYESGETYLPLDGTPRRIVDSVGGLKGKISGTLVEVEAINDTTGEEARSKLIALKALGPGANIRLAYMRRNIPVLLEDISGLDEWTEVLEEAYGVEVTFWELP